MFRCYSCGIVLGVFHWIFPIVVQVVLVVMLLVDRMMEWQTMEFTIV